MAYSASEKVEFEVQPQIISKGPFGVVERAHRYKSAAWSIVLNQEQHFVTAIPPSA
jgi:hypothetical protein